MDDAERVRLGDRVARLEDEVDRLLDAATAPVALSQPARSPPSRYSMTMYGAPFSSVPTSMHARDVLALDLDRGARLAREAGDGLGVAERLGQEELEGDLLVELDVVRRDDDAHAAHAEHPLDAVLAGQNVALAYARCRLRIAAVRHATGPFRPKSVEQRMPNVCFACISYGLTAPVKTERRLRPTARRGRSFRARCGTNGYGRGHAPRSPVAAANRPPTNVGLVGTGVSDVRCGS